MFGNNSRQRVEQRHRAAAAAFKYLKEKRASRMKLRIVTPKGSAEKAAEPIGTGVLRPSRAERRQAFR